MTHSEQNLEGTLYSWISCIESRLRHKGDRRTDEDMASIEILYAFRVNYQISQISEKEMRRTKRGYDLPVWVDGLDGKQVLEVEILKDSEPWTFIEVGEMKYIIYNPFTKVTSRIPVSTFDQSSSSAIRKVLSAV